MMICKFCGSKNVARERRPDGDDICSECNRRWPSKESKYATVIDINTSKPHWTLLAICLQCKKTWIATVMANTELFGLECPNCLSQDSFCSFVPLDYLEHSK